MPALQDVSRAVVFTRCIIPQDGVAGTMLLEDVFKTCSRRVADVRIETISPHN